MILLGRKYKMKLCPKFILFALKCRHLIQSNTDNLGMLTAEQEIQSSLRESTTFRVPLSNQKTNI